MCGIVTKTNLFCTISDNEPSTRRSQFQLTIILLSLLNYLCKYANTYFLKKRTLYVYITYICIYQ